MLPNFYNLGRFISLILVWNEFLCFVSPTEVKGLFPDLVNLATNAEITSNATCGQYGQEKYCKLTEHASNREPQCGVCDARSPDPERRHPPENAIDGKGSWWQSPSLANGPEYQWVTLTLDLKQVYQVAYVIVKSAISPRPGNWVLERSLDGNDFEPWQFYVISDSDCYSEFGLAPNRGRPTYSSDDEVICTSYFSKLNPLEGGEIHTSLINGRPGAKELSESLQRFTEARYVRLRFQRVRTLHGDLQGRTAYDDPSVTKRYFYSIKDISIGGRCVCNGHAETCDITSGQQLCSCSHNTCGNQCASCCPLFNQKLWHKGNASDESLCEKCQCFGHATACRYSEEVDRESLSLNIRGKYEGGGVCINCQDFTTGINCEKCEKGYFRPKNVRRSAKKPCRPCDCDGPGVTGDCVGDDSQVSLGIHSGSCLCKKGFVGRRCDRCAEGYLDYPTCEPCPCSRAGSVNKACEGPCICKDNVHGASCDSCKSGTFHLDVYNPLGCTQCFCNNVTGSCDAAALPIYTITMKERGKWKVTDLLKRQVIEANEEHHSKRREHARSVSIEHDQMSGFEAYYFLAPDDYLGARSTSYGQKITIKTSWEILRGDTSGRATRAPEIIIEGAGRRICYGGKYHRGKSSLTLHVPLYEEDWFHCAMDIADIKVDERVSSYKRGKVTRREMMEILSSMEALMIRARYSTMQAESFLHDAILEYGKEGAGKTEATLVTGAVERCACPEGYMGLSCELCTPGYRRLHNIIYGGICLKCDCNGHVISCDNLSGECGQCLHNTAGRHCEVCAEGYYGDATQGTPNDCKPCLCPLGIGKNAFTPRCEASIDPDGHRCFCPPGYSGAHCERCAEGHFGNPLVLGKPCRPCNCSGNVDPRAIGNCHDETGECLKCLGNTEGFNCERCKEHHYGNPLRGQCLPCSCHEIGSNSKSCEGNSGQCPCKRHYTGRQCERCVKGRGGITEGCPKCRCDKRGSISSVCDPVTGQCPCRPGVGGRHCNSCLKDHFGDIGYGCNRCNCDPSGSLSSTCDIVSGQCPCRPHVVGRTCNGCKNGYWGLSAGLDCQQCFCDGTGSVDGRCDDANGHCICQQGVGGSRCEKCLPGYWGFSKYGCKPCDPCTAPGRNCDPNSGRCVCPPHTEGDRCERCSQGFWEYSADIGCKHCNCSGPGSLERQCDPRNGRCVCRKGFEGPRCNRCSSGYFNYPNCHPCNCNRLGTDQSQCPDGQCQCDESGQCPCKVNVGGVSCDRCLKGTFGLSETNPQGCFRCFCFERSSECEQARLTWSPLALPGSRRMELSDKETELNVTNSHHVIPGSDGDVSIGTSLPFLAPLYWQLPRQFLTDKVLSYNGYLRFRVETEGTQKEFPLHILQSYPLVSLQGNWQLVLEYYPENISPDGRYSVRLHESLWRLKNDPSSRLSRKKMMIALQNIQHILIRATSSDDFSSAILSEVTLDVATEGTPVSSKKAYGVEQCTCPLGYTGTSCQDPSSGFFRERIPNFNISTVIIDVVGYSEPCDCNGRADICDQDTGVCINCRENTAGDNCEDCAIGYYGNPNVRGKMCRPCACPTRQQNFAETCHSDSDSSVLNSYICHCREGYTGKKCERCAVGYYGNPTELGGSCKRCKCDPNGSIGKGCDSKGKCRCRPGITGDDCSQCAERHVVSENGCTSCVDGCVDVLLDDVEEMIKNATAVVPPGIILPPWGALNEIKIKTTELESQLQHYESRVDVSQKLLLDFDLDFTGKVLFDRVKRTVADASTNVPVALDIKLEAKTQMDLIKSLSEKLSKIISYLNNYAIGETPTISIAAALDEAQLILQEIKARNFKEFKEDTIVELTRAQELLDRVILMQQDGNAVDKLFFRFQSLDGKITDLLKRIKSSQIESDQTKTLNEVLRERMERIRDILDRISKLQLHTETTNFNSTRYVKKAERNLQNTISNLDRLSFLLHDMQNKTTYLGEAVNEAWQIKQEYEIKYVERVEEHALHLEAQAIKLEDQFAETKDVADGPLQAASAYERIIDAINAAEEAAKNASIAANKAYYQAFPGDPNDSIIRRSNQALLKSEDLRTKGDGLQQGVDSIAKDLEAHQNSLFITKGVIDNSNRMLDSMHHIIRTQFFNVTSIGIDEALREINITKIKVESTLHFVISIKENLTVIRNYAADMSTLDKSLYDELEKTISNIKGATVKGERVTKNLRLQSLRVESRGTNLHDRIEALKRKIEQTRQYASSIRVSLTTDANGQCSRQYRPFLEPSTTNKLTFGYAINSRKKDSLLFFMGAEDKRDFMAVEMRNRQIYFTWDAGGGSQTIMHPLELEKNDRKASDETKWYHIIANRVGNIGELTVRPAYIKHYSRRELYDQPITGYSTAGYSRMDLSFDDPVWIGGFPEDKASFVRAKKFAGCLHYVTIDGEPLGLWNFTKSRGCDACNEGYELQVREEDKTSYGLNGKGYFKGKNIIRWPKKYYSVILSFKSLDENALLFLSVNEAKNQYFHIGLEDGRVTFTVQFSEQDKLVLKSEKKFNNLNSLIQVQATVEKSPRRGERMGRLVVGDQDQVATIRDGPDLDIDREPFFFGGVEPEFNKDRWGKVIELRSLLGCMGGLSVLEVGKNPHTDGKFYGFDTSCPNKPLTNVGFLGNGFLELPSKVLEKVSSFGFTFKTMDTDTLLMVSTFVGQEDDNEVDSTTTTTTPSPLRGASAHPPDYYSVSLVEGHLDLRLYTGSSKHRVMTRKTFNDGKLHSFFVTKNNRKIRLFVDDEDVNGTRLDRGNHVVEAPPEGGLYFGGIPPELNLGAMVGSSIPLKGCIQDVIINKTVISFNDPARFNNAFIGRCADLPRNVMGGMESDMKDTFSCHPPRQHTVEYGALKFGDQSQSYVVVPLKKNIFKKNLEISFEFRTFYPTGLFFLAYNHRMVRGKDRVHLLSAEIQNGRLLITVKNKKKEKRIVSQLSGLNSGLWRKVVLQKAHKRLRIFVDGELIENVRIGRKSRYGNRMFIGGLPNSLLEEKIIKAKEPFRGCFRNLFINEEEYEIPSRTRVDQITGVGQCFAAVQPGSYFPGDAYAIYENYFQVGPLLELQLEFRTWELNGVILAVADEDRNVAVSLEIVNGAVILTVDVGHLHPISARVAMDNRYSLCDNHWHTIRAHYIKDYLTLKVDSYPEAYGFNGSNDLKKTLAEAPMYIGGLPDEAPTGTLTTRDNFKGCIRNIVLNNDRRDWTDMFKLHNVLLNACPIL